MLFFLFVIGFVDAQQDSIEFKLEKIQKSSSDSIKSLLFNELSATSASLKQIKDQQRFADSAFAYAKKSNNASVLIQSINSQINVAIKQQDTTRVYQLFKDGLELNQKSSISILDDNFLRFKLIEIYYKVRQGKFSSDVGILEYEKVYKLVEKTDKYDVITEILGRMSLLYRNRKELGKALNYNTLEQEFAEKSGNKKEVAAAKITELDLSHQLLPSSSNPADVAPLILKAKEAEAYMRENKILDFLPFSQLYLAKFYVHQNSYKEGKNVLLSISDSLSVRVVFSKYEQLCEIAKSTQDLEGYREYTLKFKPLAYSTKRSFVALNVHNYLIDYFIKSQQKDSASFYANKLEGNLQRVDTTQFLDYVYFSYDVLSNHFSNVNNKEKSNRYREYANNVTKRLVANQKQAFVNMIKYKEEVKALQNENSNLTSAISFFRKNLVYIILFSIVLLLMVFYFFKKYKKSDQTSKSLEEEKKDIIKNSERKNIILNNKQKIYLDDIKYVKSDRNYVEFYYKDKKMVDRNHLKNVMMELPPNFVQVHRSYVINKNFIKVINANSLVLEPNTEIPVSRTFKKNI